MKVQKVWWNEVRDKVYKVNQNLAIICDKISPSKKYPLLRIRYPYGAEIVNKGIFNLPFADNQCIPLHDTRISDDLKKQLGYSSIPLSIVLHNNTEIFVDSASSITSLNFFKPGDLFGVFETISSLMGNLSNPLWSVTSGGRSVFMIPSIANKIGHNKIRKKFGIASETPNDLNSQWKIFKGIYQHSEEVEKWYNEVLVFPNTWFENHHNELSWLQFYKYLLNLYWEQSQLLRDTTDFSLLWSSLVDEISNCNLKPRPYLIDTLKHLVLISNGTGIAFTPATDESALPVSLIQKAYVDCYGLKTYIPHLMQPCKLQGIEKQVYYSLAWPTVLESSSYVRNAPSIIEDERIIKRLLDILIRAIKNGNNIINPIKYAKYEFFHSDIDQYREISSSKDIPNEDSRFRVTRSNQFKDRIFCSTSPFFRGCIRISLIS